MFIDTFFSQRIDKELSINDVGNPNFGKGIECSKISTVENDEDYILTLKKTKALKLSLRDALLFL